MQRSALQLFDIVERLGNLMRASLRKVGAAHNLQPVHVQALMYLAQANRYSNTPQSISEYLGLTKGTVSQSLLLLSRRGLVARAPDEKDKRQVRLFLTPAGKNLLKDGALVPEWKRAAGEVSPARMRIANTVMRETLQGLQVGIGGRSFGVCSSCRHNIREGPRTFVCGITSERLASTDTRKICREHEPKP